MLRTNSLRATKWNQLFSWQTYPSSTRLCFRPSLVKITHKLWTISSGVAAVKIKSETFCVRPRQRQSAGIITSGNISFKVWASETGKHQKNPCCCLCRAGCCVDKVCGERGGKENTEDIFQHLLTWPSSSAPNSQRKMPCPLVFLVFRSKKWVNICLIKVT